MGPRECKKCVADGKKHPTKDPKVAPNAQTVAQRASKWTPGGPSKLVKKGPGNYTWLAAGRKGTPSQGMIYLASNKDWMARFNMSWVMQEKTRTSGQER